MLALLFMLSAKKRTQIIGVLISRHTTSAIFYLYNCTLKKFKLLTNKFTQPGLTQMEKSKSS